MQVPTSEQIEISTNDGLMPATLAVPLLARGAVVVVQEAFGVTPHLESICHRLASVGWPAVAPSLFHRQGSPVGPVRLSAAHRDCANAAAPWLGLYADLDKSIPADDVELLRAAAATAVVPSEVVRYPDAEHGFNCDDRTAVYNATAGTDAWQRTLAWLDQFIPPVPG